MKFIKNNWLRLLVWPPTVALIVVCLVLIKNAERDAMERLNPYLRVIRLREKEHEAFHAACRAKLAALIREGKMNTSLPPIKQIKVNKPASQFTAEEKQTLAELFTERFKPAIEHWANAYKGHIPFDVSDINVTNFYSVTAGNYTFMLGSTTLVIFNGVHGAKVFYMMTKQGAHDLNSFPTDGKPRSLTVPITWEEVLKMAEADTGLHYELKDVVINPTAKFSNIDGGAEVQVGIKYNAAGMMLITPDNLGFVLDSNGMLVTYQH